MGAKARPVESKTVQHLCKAGAFTLIEMLCVMAVIAILASLLLPALAQGKSRAKRIQCVNHLKEQGHAFHAYLHDHNDRFPMQVTMSDGGSLEYVQEGDRVMGEFYFSYRHFQSLSNELVTPKILACPSDLERPPAPNFTSFKNEHLSYFVGVKAEFARPASILAGDRNITNDQPASPTIVRSTLSHPFRWTQALHRFKGNLLFADGHVQELNEARLASLDSAALHSDLVLPSYRPGVSLVEIRPASEASAVVAPLVPDRLSPAATALLIRAAGAVQPFLLPAATALNSNAPSITPNEPATNAPATTPSTPAPGPGSASGNSGFTETLDDLATRFHLPVWFLYLLPILLLLGIGAMLLRLRRRTTS